MSRIVVICYSAPGNAQALTEALAERLSRDAGNRTGVGL